MIWSRVKSKGTGSDILYNPLRFWTSLLRATKAWSMQILNYGHRSPSVISLQTCRVPDVSEKLTETTDDGVDRIPTPDAELDWDKRSRPPHFTSKRIDHGNLVYASLGGFRFMETSQRTVDQTKIRLERGSASQLGYISMSPDEEERADWYWSWVANSTTQKPVEKEQSCGS
jgi:hypothetical protein